MSYKKIIKKFKEYAGESFSESIPKEDGSRWAVTEVASYVLVGTNGIIVDNPLADPIVQTIGTYGDLEKSSDNKLLTFTIPSSATSGLNGNYKVLVDLKDSSNSDISDVIAEYDIEYKLRTS